jgi:hypothetical protein
MLRAYLKVATQLGDIYQISERLAPGSEFRYVAEQETSCNESNCGILFAIG